VVLSRTKPTRFPFHGNKKEGGMRVDVDLTSQRSQDGLGLSRSHGLGSGGPLVTFGRVTHGMYH